MLKLSKSPHWIKSYSHLKDADRQHKVGRCRIPKQLEIKVRFMLVVVVKFCRILHRPPGSQGGCKVRPILGNIILWGDSGQPCRTLMWLMDTTREEV